MNWHWCLSLGGLYPSPTTRHAPALKCLKFTAQDKTVQSDIGSGLGNYIGNDHNSFIPGCKPHGNRKGGLSSLACGISQFIFPSVLVRVVILAWWCFTALLHLWPLYQHIHVLLSQQTGVEGPRNREISPFAFPSSALCVLQKACSAWFQHGSQSGLSEWQKRGSLYPPPSCPQTNRYHVMRTKCDPV